MKRVILVALASLFVASSALAVVVPDDGTNSVGVYFDNGGVMENVTTAAANDQVTFYIVLVGLTAPTVGGWELKLDLTDDIPSVLLDDGLADDALNVASAPEYIVGLGTPVAPDADGSVVLAMPVLMVLAEGTVDFYGGPTDPSSLNPPRPDYVNGDDLSEIIPMNYSVDANGQHVGDDGACTLIIASINGEAAVATEDATWSSVKSMYR